MARGLGLAYRFPALSFSGASLAKPWSVSTLPLIKPDVRFPAARFRTRYHAFAHGKLRLIQRSRTSPSSRYRYSAENRDVPAPFTLCYG